MDFLHTTSIHSKTIISRQCKISRFGGWSWQYGKGQTGAGRFINNQSNIHSCTRFWLSSFHFLLLSLVRLEFWGEAFFSFLHLFYYSFFRGQRKGWDLYGIVCYFAGHCSVFCTIVWMGRSSELSCDFCLFFLDIVKHVCIWKAFAGLVILEIYPIVTSFIPW